MTSHSKFEITVLIVAINESKCHNQGSFKLHIHGYFNFPEVFTRCNHLMKDARNCATLALARRSGIFMKTFRNAGIPSTPLHGKIPADKIFEWPLKYKGIFLNIMSGFAYYLSNRTK